MINLDMILLINPLLSLTALSQLSSHAYAYGDATVDPRDSLEVTTKGGPDTVELQVAIDLWFYFYEWRHDAKRF